MRLVCKNTICRIYAIRKDNQVVINIKITKKLPRRGRRSGKGKTRR
jgi:hypothetical protein